MTGGEVSWMRKKESVSLRWPMMMVIGVVQWVIGNCRVKWETAGREEVVVMRPGELIWPEELGADQGTRCRQGARDWPWVRAHAQVNAYTELT